MVWDSTRIVATTLLAHKPARVALLHIDLAGPGNLLPVLLKQGRQVFPAV